MKLEKSNFVGLVFTLSDGTQQLVECSDPDVKDAVEKWLEALYSNPAMLDEVFVKGSLEWKRAKLVRAGWQALWHEDNWVKKAWFDDPRIDIDRAGSSLESAYDKEFKTLKIKLP